MSGSEDEEYAYDSDGDEDEAGETSDIDASNSDDEVVHRVDSFIRVFPQKIVALLSFCLTLV